MAAEQFIDTSGFYAALNPHDQWHERVTKALDSVASSGRFITTDYVLDETATLLRARGQSRLVDHWLTNLLKSSEIEIVWMSPARFDEVRDFFSKHDDKAWSFTDCFSFCVM